jgi:hypothetical protein
MLEHHASTTTRFMYYTIVGIEPFGWRLEADLVDGTKDGTDHAGTLYLSQKLSRLHHLEDRIKVCRRNISHS